MAGLLDDPSGYVGGLLGDVWRRFRGVDPQTGQADYWNRGGVAGLLGMPSWDEQSPTDIAMGFAGSTTPAVKGILGAMSKSPIGMVDDLASRVAKHAESLGYKIEKGGSNLSDSQYLTLAHEALGEPVRIRVADHTLPPTYARRSEFNMEVGPHGEATGWHDAVAALARRIGARVPEEAASEIAREVAERQAWAEAEAARAMAYQERANARQAALDAAPQSDEASRIADLQERLANPAVTGNQRKKLNAKLRKALSRVRLDGES